MASIQNRNLAIQRVFKARGYDTDDIMNLRVSMHKLKSTNFNATQDEVFVQGGEANSYIDAFDTTKTAIITGESALINVDLLSLQNGNEIITVASGTDVRYEEVVTVGAGNTALTKFTATGTADAEIGYAYVLNSNGTVNTRLSQAALASATEFTYDTGTKTLTFDASVVEGTEVRISYFPTTTDYDSVSSLASGITENLRWEFDAQFKDVCTNTYYNGTITFYKGKINGGFEWALSGGGDPAVHNFTVTALEKNCSDDTMWRLDLWKESNMS